MMRWFGRVTSFRVIGPTLVLVAAAVLAASSLVASGQASADPGDDPSLEPIPTIEPQDTAQSFVVRVLFNGPTEVQFLSGGVSHAPPPARIGGPPLIKVEVFHVTGALVEEFNAWHPLWVEHEGEDGELEMIVEESGEGRFVFPFAPDIGDVMISDIELDLELIEIDAHQIVVDYCADNASDPGCASVPAFCPADVNRDGKVDFRDLRIVARALFTQPGMARWNPAADVNKDGLVDVRDLLITIISFFDPDCR